MGHFGPFWPKEVPFGPFRSANRTLATPEPSLGRAHIKGVMQPHAFLEGFLEGSLKECFLEGFLEGAL